MIGYPACQRRHAPDFVNIIRTQGLFAAGEEGQRCTIMGVLFFYFITLFFCSFVLSCLLSIAWLFLLWTRNNLPGGPGPVFLFCLVRCCFFPGTQEKRNSLTEHHHESLENQQVLPSRKKSHQRSINTYSYVTSKTRHLIIRAVSCNLGCHLGGTPLHGDHEHCPSRTTHLSTGYRLIRVNITSTPAPSPSVAAIQSDMTTASVQLGTRHVTTRFFLCVLC